MEHRVAELGARTRRRATAPRPVRLVARAAGLTLRGLAEAILDGQPKPVRPRDQAALLRWLGQSVRSEHPDAALDEQAGIMADRLQEMADSGDETATAMLKAEGDEVALKLAQVEFALAGGGEQWAPHPPEVPKQQRMDSARFTALRLGVGDQHDGGGRLPLAVRRRGAVRDRHGAARRGRSALHREPRTRAVRVPHPARSSAC